MIKTGGLLFLLLATAHSLFAQKHFNYENTVYLPQVKTVQCYTSQKEQSVPLINLKSKDQLLLSFDDLDGGTKNYSYTIEHCTSDWKPSGLSTIDYLNGFSTDRINEYSYASNTLQKFTHYELKLPNDQVSPKISGNYLLKVYLDDDLNKPVLSQRFYVLDNQASVVMELVPSQQVSLRNTNQKVNFTVSFSGTVQNPFTDIKTVLIQNRIPQTALSNARPSAIRPGALVYNDPQQNDFPAGNEFRKFDIRSLRYKTERVQDILRDTANEVILFADQPTIGKYANLIDENGKFFIRNQDDRDPATESDYANVTFTLDATQLSSQDDVYVVGGFNNYATNESSRMRYDAARKRYVTTLKLKQGLYDYKYFLKSKSGQIDQTALEGSFFEAENEYLVFVYYKRPGSRWEELIGYQLRSR